MTNPPLERTAAAVYSLAVERRAGAAAALNGLTLFATAVHVLVLSRIAGESIYVGSAAEASLITLLKVLPEARTIAILLNRASADAPGVLESRMVEMAIDATVKLSDTSEITLVDVREDKARIGINAPKESSVHRLEVYDAIRRENRRRGSDPEDGFAGSRIPRPSSPKPPSLDVRFNEPPAAYGGGE